MLHPSVRKLIYQQFRLNLTLIPGHAYLKKSEKHTCHVYRKRTGYKGKRLFKQGAGEAGLRSVTLFAMPAVYQ